MSRNRYHGDYRGDEMDVADVNVENEEFVQLSESDVSEDISSSNEDRAFDDDSQDLDEEVVDEGEEVPQSRANGTIDSEGTYHAYSVQPSLQEDAVNQRKFPFFNARKQMSSSTEKKSKITRIEEVHMYDEDEIQLGNFDDESESMDSPVPDQDYPAVETEALSSMTGGESYGETPFGSYRESSSVNEIDFKGQSIGSSSRIENAMGAVSQDGDENNVEQINEGYMESNSHHIVDEEIDEVMLQEPDELELKFDHVIDEQNKEYSKIRNEARQMIESNPLNEPVYALPPNIVKKYGKAHVLIVKGGCIIIGTRNGNVLLKRPSGNPLHFEQMPKGLYVDANPVTCIDFLPEQNAIIAGFERGQIVIWDTESTQITRTVTEFNESVECISFLRDKNKFISSCGSQLKLFQITKMFFTNTLSSKVVLEKTFGIVRSIEVLPVPPNISNPTNAYLVAAVCTDFELVVICLRPVISILSRIGPFQSVKKYLPSVSWWPVRKFSRFQGKDDVVKGKDPMLAFGRAKIIHFLQLHKLESELKLLALSSIELDQVIVALAWIHERVVFSIDENMMLTVIDPFTQQKLKTLSLIDFKFHFHSRFDYTEMQENTEKLIKLPCFEHSYSSANYKLYILGDNLVHSLNVIPWNRRVQRLMDVGDWQDGMDMLLNVYHNKKDVIGVVGLSNNPEKARKVVGETIKGYLLNYLDETIPENIDIDDLTFLEDVCHRIIEYALEINDNALIFDELHERFSKRAHWKAIFTENIESLIAAGKLSNIPKDYLENCIIKKYVKDDQHDFLENLLVNIDPSDMDEEKLIAHCLSNHMYKTLVYVFVSKDEHIQAFHTLLTEIPKARKSQWMPNLTNVTFEFLTNCFLGLSYPSGIIPLSKLIALKPELLYHLFVKQSYLNLMESSAKRFFQLLKISFEDIGSPTSPWGRKENLIVSRNEKLSSQDKQEFFNQAKEFFVTLQTHSRKMQDSKVLRGEGKELSDIKKQIKRIQWNSPWSRPWIVILLFETLVDENTDPWKIKNLEQQAYFFYFLVHFIAIGSLTIEPKLINRMLVVLSAFHTEFGDGEIDEIQNDLLKIIQKFDSDKEEMLWMDRLLKDCETAGFYRVSAHLHERKKDFKSTLVSHMKDSELREKIFDYIHRQCKSLKQSDLQVFKNAILSQLSSLLEVDPYESGHLLGTYFVKEQVKIFQSFKQEKFVQFNFLKYLFIDRESRPLFDRYSIDEILKKAYFELLCEYEPDSVAEFLEKNFDADNFNDPVLMDAALQLCKKHGLTNATSNILVRGGDIQGAIQLHLDGLNDEFLHLRTFFQFQARKLDPQNDLYVDVNTFWFLHRDTALLYRSSHQKNHVQEGLDQKRGKKTLKRTNGNKKQVENDIIPKIGSQHIWETNEYKRFFTKLSDAIQILEKNSNNRMLHQEEIDKLWLQIFHFFYENLDKLHSEYCGTKNQPKKSKRSIKNRKRVSKQALFDSSDEDDDVLDHKLGEAQLQSAFKQLEMQKKFLSKKISSIITKEEKEKYQTILETTNSQLKELMVCHGTVTPAIQDIFNVLQLPKLANIWLQKCLSIILKYVCSRIINFFSSKIQLLRKISTLYSSGDFGHFRKAIFDTLDDLDYEKKVRRNVSHLIRVNMTQLSKRYVKSVGFGKRPVIRKCCSCKNLLKENAGVMTFEKSDPKDIPLVLFNCGHAYHETCLEHMTGHVKVCIVCQDGLERKKSLSHQNEASRKPNEIESPEEIQLKQKRLFLQQQWKKYQTINQRGGRTDSEINFAMREDFSEKTDFYYSTTILGQPLPNKNVRGSHRNWRSRQTPVIKSPLPPIAQKPADLLDDDLSDDEYFDDGSEDFDDGSESLHALSEVSETGEETGYLFSGFKSHS